MRLPVPLLLAALAALLLPAAAHAQTVVAADPAAQQLTALAGSVVWSSAAEDGEVLMRRDERGRVARVPRTPPARVYRSLDLGLDAGGELVLTYLRCSTFTRCVPYADDLRGTRKRVRGLERDGCRLSTAPAMWRSTQAYGLVCRRGGRFDRRRSGLYAQTKRARPRRLPAPPRALGTGSLLVTSVDLRGSRAAAITADINEYAYSVRTSGRGLQAFLAATSEGDGNARAGGLALGSGDALWTLVTSEHAGDPNEAVIFRSTGGCLGIERLANASEQETGFRAVDIAVDGGTVYLVAPGTGITTHAFAPERPCG
ncbi:MAG: hypothetical protein AVDCRST_MAG30-528 [uncultured Solirubrobacteraceae bacterium]|uniref:Uncharacterized protein n=1 Tax=uncultured Solirubrobacteraceae bacterium TaxID=1162706 RepID=A0A6J4RTH7_9ACTN|nr:MAG: hypothetical protein AVDCRST_MAG30-528 [uncultured Solirubrobacteraceae bacterium]